MHETKRPLKVFLCHASVDKPKVRELYRYLKRRGIKPWLDEVDLIGGQNWQIEIPKALATSDAIIICLTKNSVDKEGYIQKEIKFALDKALDMPEGRIFLIPVKFEECGIPVSLNRYQWVDLSNEIGYSKMMKALKFRASQLERTTVELPKKTVEEVNLATEQVAREKAKREADEKAAQEKVKREAVEKSAREKTERETAEKAVLQKTEHAAFEQAAREKAMRASAEKFNRKKDEREAIEKAKQKAEREVVEKVADEKVIRETNGRALKLAEENVESLKPDVKITEGQEIPPSKNETTKTAPRRDAPAEKPQKSNKKREHLSLKKIPSSYLLGGVILIVMACLGVGGLTTILSSMKAINAINATDTAYAATSASYNTTYTVNQANLTGTSASYDATSTADQASYNATMSELATWTAEAHFDNATSTAHYATLAADDANTAYAMTNTAVADAATLAFLYTQTPTPLSTEITDDKGVPMILVPAGKFTMGSDDNNFINENPTHFVNLNAYYIDKFEVTNAYYNFCVKEGICKPPTKRSSTSHESYFGNPSFDNYPVIYVTWDMAQTYCEWRGTRLPTEAEWEKAARGTDGRVYPWGDTIVDSNANYNVLIGDPINVGKYASGVSPYGLFDMAGNVQEWVNDWYQENYYSTISSGILNPQGPSLGQERVLRSGSWDAGENFIRTSYRFKSSPSSSFYNIGFRCAKNAIP